MSIMTVDDDHGIDLTPKVLRDFGLIMAGMIIFMFGLLIPWIWSFKTPLWPFIAASVFALLGLLYTPALAPVYKGWMKIGGVLGWINTRIILGFIFFVFFFPFGMVMRLFGKDPMARELDSKTASYRVKSASQPADHLRNPY